MTSSSYGSSALHASSEQWFGRARATALGVLPCRQGCDRCCIGPFAITMLDVIELRRGWPSLVSSVREDIEAKARRQVVMIESAFPRLKACVTLDAWDDGEVDDLVERFHDLPCPALHDDGSCRVYAVRPVTCRMMGIPVETGGLVTGACEVQTAIPTLRTSVALREEEQQIARQEAAELKRWQQSLPGMGEEVLLPYGFLEDRISVPR